MKSYFFFLAFFLAFFAAIEYLLLSFPGVGQSQGGKFGPRHKEQNFLFLPSHIL
jgi:hypothetical protein